MKKRLPPWCKLVKHTLIDKDMDVSELATKTGLARPYLSSIINGRIYSQPAVNKVSDCLGISNDYDAMELCGQQTTEITELTCTGLRNTVRFTGGCRDGILHLILTIFFERWRKKRYGRYNKKSKCTDCK